MLSPARAAELTKLLIQSDDDQVTHALIELLHGIADPKGNDERYQAAQSAMTVAYERTEDFQQALDNYVQHGPGRLTPQNLGENSN